MILKYLITEEITIKDFLVKNLSQNIIKTLNSALVAYIVNDQNVKNYFVMKQGDTLNIVIPPTPTNVEPKKGELDIVYEDSYLLVVNKPSNLATIPTRRHFNNSLANIVAYYYIQKGINEGVHAVGRLDYATSGLIIFAKGPVVTELMKSHLLKKEYLVEVEGLLEDTEVYSNIVRDETSIIKRKNTIGTSAHTSFKLLERKENKTLLLATLHTGKTHQIRLHVLKCGASVVGDELYGSGNVGDILHLHCAKLVFKHPVTSEVITLESKPEWY